jgi:hypothetical protein
MGNFTNKAKSVNVVQTYLKIIFTTEERKHHVVTHPAVIYIKILTVVN